MSILRRALKAKQHTVKVLDIGQGRETDEWMRDKEKMNNKAAIRVTLLS
jgi:hypothetical protein